MEINTRDVRNVVVFDINGEITRPAEAALHQFVKTQLEEGRRNILLNFQNVGFIDSFGVGEILASYISIHNLGGKFKLCHISRKLYIIFQVTGLIKVLEIFDDCESALKAFGEP
jgi:anti-anti-sigma factor